MASRRIAATFVVLSAILALPASAVAVTGGKPASRPYPHMAALYDEVGLLCGASLVAPDWILTAAHCFEEVKASEVSFVIGGENLNGAGGERRVPSEVIVHELFDADELRYDVALARLSQASTKTPIRLASPDTERDLWAPAKPARVIGYGLPSVDLVGALFETDVPIVGDQQCASSYDRTVGDFDPTTMVCAGELYGVKDSCYGDSGGPLMVPSTGTLDGGTLVQVGVVSWGFTCGVPTQYGVYSRVADRPLYDWITSRAGTGGGSSGAPAEEQSRSSAPVRRVYAGRLGIGGRYVRFAFPAAFKPRTLDPSPRRANPYLYALRWRGWGTPRAVGTGKAKANDLRSRGASVRLTRLREGACRGQEALFYTRARLYFPRRLGVRAFTVRLRTGCGRN